MRYPVKYYIVPLRCEILYSTTKKYRILVKSLCLLRNND